MKGGLCVICTSLLSILVVSSCALFLIVVSETIQGDNPENQIDVSGLQNVSDKNTKDNQEIPQDGSGQVDGPQNDQKIIFPDALSLNSVTTDGLPDTGQPPILISLADPTKLDLKAEELLYANESEQRNDTKTYTIVDDASKADAKKTEPKDKEPLEKHLVFQAKPMHETRTTEEPYQTTPAPDVSTSNESQTEKLDVNYTVDDVPTKPQTPQEDIPSFSEWAQKQLAEAEKQDTVLNHSTQTSQSNSNFSTKNTKIRSKNYASPACGAKIVAVNPEAGSASSILSPNRDEYMLNTCNSRIWFVVELCEAVQAQQIELANFELFSSTPKDISVYFSDRFPTREWASVGQFTAKEIRDVQSFDLHPHLFGKFIKVELHSHYGSEHYCPISLFKVYGTSEFEVLEKESAQHSAHIEDPDDDEVVDVPTEKETSKNLFGSARDAVMSIMKKAAQVLVKTEVPKNASSLHNDTSKDNVYKKCCSPSHIIVCDNCSEALYNEVFELISCNTDRITTLLRQVFMKETLKCTGICQPFGLYFNKSTKTIEFGQQRVNYLNALYPQKYIAALCNMLAINEKKVVLNTSHETESNKTANFTLDDTKTKPNSDSKIEQNIKLPTQVDNTSKDDKTNTPPTKSDNQKEEQIPVGDVKKEDQNPTINKVEDTKSDSSKTADVKVELVQSDTTKDNSTGVPSTTNDTAKPDIQEDQSKVETKNGNGKVDDKKESQDEINDPILIENDSFLNDFDQLTADPTPSGQPSQSPGPGAPKESVFLRLANRVKTLERNMSLSGQYLEELSRRYKKQVEEMQKTFEKTVLQMTEERRKSNEREQKYLDQMSTMQEDISRMSFSLRQLIEERDSWFGSLTFFKFLLYQSLVIGVAYYILANRQPVPKKELPVQKKIKKKEKLRRKSVEGVSGHVSPVAKKRRPSEEALQIARQSTENVAKDDDGEWQVARKNRRRKSSILHRQLEDKLMWGRQDSIGIGRLQENPIPLDNDEFLSPVPEPTEFIETAPKKQLPKINGSIIGSIKSKTMKARRLSSPAFLRTFSRNSSRSNPSSIVKCLEPATNGSVKQKAASESPTSSLWSTETTPVDGIGKRRKGLKNIFKKVF